MNTPHEHSRYLTLGMMLVATNMRLPITMMPGLMHSLQQTIGLPSSLAGLITTIPLLTFAVMSPLIARWGRRFGNEWTIYVMLILLAVGSYLRVIPTVASLLLGTFLVGIGVDGGNVLIPAVIKDNFPTKINVATSEYTLSMLFDWIVGHRTFWRPCCTLATFINHCRVIRNRACELSRLVTQSKIQSPSTRDNGTSYPRYPSQRLAHPSRLDCHRLLWVTGFGLLLFAHLVTHHS